MSSASKILIFSGFLLIFFGTYLFLDRYSSRKLEFQDLKISKTVSSKIIPVRIIISALKIDSGIYPAKIDNGKWEATQNGISYLSSSPVPGSKGNAILYGHNFPNLLGNLNKIKPADIIEVVMNTGERKKFKVEFTHIVTPSQTHILSQTTDSRITLYTCTGFLDSKRFVAIAKLLK